MTLPVFRGSTQEALIRLFETHLTLRVGRAAEQVDRPRGDVRVALERLVAGGEISRAVLAPQHVEYFMTERQRWVAFGPIFVEPPEPKPPRPARMKQINVSLDDETIAEIDAAATARGQNRSEFVRDRLEWALMDLEHA